MQVCQILVYQFPVWNRDLNSHKRYFKSTSYFWIILWEIVRHSRKILCTINLKYRKLPTILVENEKALGSLSTWCNQVHEFWKELLPPQYILCNAFRNTIESCIFWEQKSQQFLSFTMLFYFFLMLTLMFLEIHRNQEMNSFTNQNFFAQGWLLRLAEVLTFIEVMEHFRRAAIKLYQHIRSIMHIFCIHYIF